MHLLDDVRRGLALEDYEAVATSLFAELSSEPGVLALGLFGEFSNPGISDVDALVIAEPWACRALKDQITGWLNSQDLAHYLFSHMPLLVPETMLEHSRFLHTLYQARWVHQLRPLDLPPAGEPHTGFLELVWTSFLLAAIADVALMPSISLRFLLLLLKNIHQSCENLSQRLGELHRFKDRSHALRLQVIASPLADEDLLRAVDLEYQRSVDVLFGLVDRISERAALDAPLPPLIPLSRGISVCPAPYTALEVGDRQAIVRVSRGFCDALLGSGAASQWANARVRYRAAQAAIQALADDCGIDNPFISPFGLPADRSRLKTLLIGTYNRFLMATETPHTHHGGRR